MKNGLKSYTLKPGFSLVEMLMALLVASLLMAALAPVMTRKFADNVNINANNTTQSKGWRLYTYAPDCEKEEGNDSICVFNDFKIPKGVYALNLIMVSGGGGGGGSTAETLSNTETVTKTSDGVKTDTREYDEQIIPITEYMTNVKLESLIGAGGGGSGESVSTGVVPSSSACANYGTGKTDTNGYTGTNFAVYDGVNKICVTKYNQRAASGCWSGYTQVPSSGNSVRCSSKAVNNTTILYSYSGCGRTVCTKTAAQNACSSIAASTNDPWRLPTEAEKNGWKDNTGVQQALMLCMPHSGTYVSQCMHSDTALNGKYYGCPYMIWSDTSGAFWDNCMYNGSYTNNITNASFPVSVRCVLSATKAFYSNSGAHGSMLSNIDLTNHIKEAGNNGQIVLRAGRPGSGGDSVSSVDTAGENGENGYRSCVYIQKKPTAGTYGDTVYALCAYGGDSGKGSIATKENNTYGSSITRAETLPYCREYSNGSWKNLSCTAVSSGTYGIGGNGGSGTDVSGDTITTSPGLAGTGGVVKLTYQNEFAGAGGGGGAGGTFVKITNLSLDADTECTVKVGGGGSYGSGQDGKNGGDTSIKCGNSKEYIVYGGGGGKLGTSGVDMAAPKPVGGKGGARGKVSENIKQLGTLAEIVYGEENSAVAAPEILSKINGNLNVGGNGGKSGTGAIGGCGGLRPNDDPDCTNPNSNATLAEYVTPVYTSLIAETPDYGKAGAGGGGGGWSKTLSPKQGTGSSGAPGFLFLWWNQD